MTRFASRFFMFLATGLAVSSFSAGTALAHNKQLSSSPADGEILTSSPLQWALKFDKTVPLASASGEVVKSDGVRNPLPTPRYGDSDRTIVFDFPPELTGSVTARWRLIGTDGHVITGRIRFSVQSTVVTTAPSIPSSSTSVGGAAGSSTTTFSASPPTTNAVSSEITGSDFDDGVTVPEPIRIALRLMNYVSILVLGGLFFSERYLAEGTIRVPLGGLLARLSAWGIFATSALQISVFVNDISAPGENWVKGITGAFEMTPGAMLIMKTIIGALIVVETQQTVREGFVDQFRSRLFFATGALYLVSLAYGGHSRSQAAPWLGIPADVAHTAASAVWLGGLLTFLLVVIPFVDTKHAVIGFERFGFAAERAVAVLVGTGIIQTLRLHTNPFTVFTNLHGFLLIAKIGLVAVILRHAARNRRVLLAKREGDLKQSARVKRVLVQASLVELTLGGAVLVLTSVLVATTPT
jgi:copper transport protein